MTENETASDGSVGKQMTMATMYLWQEIQFGSVCCTVFHTQWSIYKFLNWGEGGCAKSSTVGSTYIDTNLYIVMEVGGTNSTAYAYVSSPQVYP